MNYDLRLIGRLNLKSEIINLKLVIVTELISLR